MKQPCYVYNIDVSVTRKELATNHFSIINIAKASCTTKHFVQTITISSGRILEAAINADNLFRVVKIKCLIIYERLGELREKFTLCNRMIFILSASNTFRLLSKMCIQKSDN